MSGMEHSVGFGHPHGADHRLEGRSAPRLRYWLRRCICGASPCGLPS